MPLQLQARIIVSTVHTNRRWRYRQQPSLSTEGRQAGRPRTKTNCKKKYTHGSHRRSRSPARSRAGRSRRGRGSPSLLCGVLHTYIQHHKSKPKRTCEARVNIGVMCDDVPRKLTPRTYRNTEYAVPAIPPYRHVQFLQHHSILSSR